MKVVILGGYAQAGKTEALKILEELGVKTCSTSAILHNIAERFVKYFLNVPGHGTVGKFKNKSLNWKISLTVMDADGAQYTIDGPWKTSREFLITLAEDVLVRTIGRMNAFVRPVLSERDSDAEFIAIESLGGVEGILLMDELNKCEVPYECINIRRSTEQPGADSRELLPDAIDVWNDGTLDDLKLELSNVLSIFRSPYSEDEEF